LRPSSGTGTSRPISYRHLGFAGAPTLSAILFQVKHDFETEYCGARDPDVARELNPAS
jgi:hypothetical protein